MMSTSLKALTAAAGIALVLAGGLSLPLAQAADRGAGEAPKSAKISFEPGRGFFSEPFRLKLGDALVSGEIRYTLDGSAPGADHGEIYREPIPITGTTVVRAAVVGAGGVVSRPQTHTYIFTADVVKQSPDGLPPAGWPYEWGANTVDYGMDPEVVNDPKYRDAIQPALKSLPSFSLVLDVEDLFGSRGIYSHSDQGGRAWERAGSVELIYPEGRKGFQEECGVRIRGGFSSGAFNPKHAFRLFFRKEYGAGKLKYPLFGENAAKEFDSFDLRCSQNYSWNIGGDVRGLFLRDQFNRDLQLAMGNPSPRGDYYHLYLNGQYWGLFNTCERPEASYGASYFGGTKEDYDVIKTSGVGGGPNSMALEATDGTMDAWERLHAAASADLSDNAAYFKMLGRRADGSPDPNLEVLLDPANLIDYLLVIWFGGNLDAPVTRFGGDRVPNNWHALRRRDGRDGFKFFVWDAEHTLLDVEEDRVGPFQSGDRAETSHPQWLFQRCMENAEFRMLVADRIHRHFGEGGVLSTASTLERFQKRVAQIEAAVICESARWGDVSGGFPFGPPGERTMRLGPDGQPRPVARTRDVEWRAEVNRQLKEYLPKRSEVVLFQLWRQGFVSDLTPPRMTAVAGEGRQSTVDLSATRGEIWVTTNGDDPRKVGGEPSATAQRVTGPLKLGAPATVKARVRHQGEWSPLVELRPGV